MRQIESTGSGWLENWLNCVAINSPNTHSEQIESICRGNLNWNLYLMIKSNSTYLTRNQSTCDSPSGNDENIQGGIVYV